jgi:hypothetical protein
MDGRVLLELQRRVWVGEFMCVNVEEAKHDVRRSVLRRELEAGPAEGLSVPTSAQLRQGSGRLGIRYSLTEEEK